MTLNPTGQKLGSVIWVTGLSSAGKTTLCQAYYKKVKPTIPHLVLLDGDAVREAFGHDPARYGDHAGLCSHRRQG